MPSPRGDVEVGLVKRDAFDQLRRCEAAKDLMDQPARLAVASTVGRDHGELWAELQRLVEGHRGAEAVSPRLVGGAHDDRPPGTTGNRDRPAAALRIVALVDGRVERVEADGKDGAPPVVRSRPVL